MSKFTNIIGLMSGTSLDGLDICAVRFEEKQLQKFEITHCKTVPYNEQLRNKLKNSIYLSNEEISNLSIAFGVIFGNATNNFIKEYNLKNIDIISSHGLAQKTIYKKNWRSNKIKSPKGVFETVSIHWIDMISYVFGIKNISRADLVNLSKNGSAYDTSNIKLIDGKILNEQEAKITEIESQINNKKQLLLAQ